MTKFFTKDHEWIEIEDDIGTVGITDYAQNQLGDVVFVELPEKGRQVKKGDEAAVVESVKAASDVYSPCVGEIIATNQEVEADPSLVNRAANHAGWFFKVKLADADGFDEYMDEAAYAAYIKELG